MLEVQARDGSDCLQTPAEEPGERDDLASPKGIALAVILSSVVWIIVAGILLWR